MRAKESSTTRRSAEFCGDVERLVASVERLRDHPQSGRVVPELRDQSIREVIHGNYRIMYRFRADVVEVATVFHGARSFRLEP